MKYMIIVKATADSEAGVMPEERLIAEMAAYHEALARAGALVDGSGLKPSAHGWRIRYAPGGGISVTDGPFTETKELVAGYTIIDVGSREEALEWTRCYPNPAIGGKAGEIEVRPFYTLDDFPASEALERHRALQASLDGEAR